MCSHLSRTMVSQLVKHERIETTVAKVPIKKRRRLRLCEFQIAHNVFVIWSQAKEIRRLADNMVQLGKEVCMGFFMILILIHVGVN